MRYVVAGYVFVLGLLFLYAVQLVWRRRRLTRAGRPGGRRGRHGRSGRHGVGARPGRGHCADHGGA